MSEIKPLVSVCVQTYQHNEYIKECLDSIVAQKTNFPFEIILGEDDSSDGTREICIAYAEKYPSLIKLFLRSREDVMYVNGKPTGRYNFLENTSAAQGKYIALCEGDDYWTDPLKLQMQVDFLNKNQDYIMCFHNASVYDQKKHKHILTYFKNDAPEKTYETKDFFGSYFIPTASVMYRNIDDLVLPDWMNHTASFDIGLYCLLSEFGKVKYLNSCMSVYRFHSGGVSRTHQGLFALRSRVFLFENLNNYFDNQYVQPLEEETERLVWNYVSKHKAEFLKKIVRHYWNKIFKKKSTTLVK